MLQNAIKRSRQVRRSGQAGFTLIELLIVIVILGVLASIVVFSVKGISDRGDLAACKAEVSTVDTAEEASYANGDGYQTDYHGLMPKYLHGDSSTALKYVTGYSSATGKVTLAGSAPSGCSAQ